MNKPKQLTFPWSRPNKSSFESFYIDPKNSLLLSIIGNKILSDDIYIFGINNSGKTYLLQSLCNFYSKHNKTALFLPIKEVISYGVGILDSIEVGRYVENAHIRDAVRIFTLWGPKFYYYKKVATY